MQSNTTPNALTPLSAKEIQDRYNQKFAWVLSFRESLPTILRIGEEMSVRLNEGNTTNWWNVGLAHLHFQAAGVIGDVTKAAPGMKNDHVLHFRVRQACASRVYFDERVETPDQLEGVCRRFFSSFKEEIARVLTAREAYLKEQAQRQRVADGLRYAAGIEVSGDPLDVNAFCTNVRQALSKHEKRTHEEVLPSGIIKKTEEWTLKCR